MFNLVHNKNTQNSKEQFQRTPALVSFSNYLSFHAIGSSKEITTLHETQYDSET